MKPENILLSSCDEEAILKICDFGLSKAMLNIKSYESYDSLFHSSYGNCSEDWGSSNSIFPSNEDTSNIWDDIGNIKLSKDEALVGNSLGQVPYQRMYSDVGTTFYQAPEIKNNGSNGYIGSLSDIFSSGILLYNLLTGEYPFNPNPDLDSCPRYKEFKSWSENIDLHGPTSQLPLFLTWNSWSHHARLSPALTDLLCSLLHPDPSKRLSASAALQHKWFHEEDQRSSIDPILGKGSVGSSPHVPVSPHVSEGGGGGGLFDLTCPQTDEADVLNTSRLSESRLTMSLRTGQKNSCMVSDKIIANVSNNSDQRDFLMEFSDGSGS